MNGTILFLLMLPVASGQSPDLAVADFNISADCNTLTINVEVENSGNADASTFSVALFYDSPQEPPYSQQPNESFQIDGLSAGLSVTKSAIWEEAPLGEHIIWLRLDNKQQVTEFSVNESGVNVGEQNNLDSFTLQVTLNKTGCPCIDRELIMMPCTCGTDMAALGYCCDGTWQADSCLDDGQQPTKYVPPPEPAPKDPSSAGTGDDGTAEQTSGGFSFGDSPADQGGVEYDKPQMPSMQTEIVRRRVSCSASDRPYNVFWPTLLLLLSLVALRVRRAAGL